MRRKNVVKIKKKRGQMGNISELLSTSLRTTVTRELDGSNGVYAHAQKEVVKKGSKCYPIVEIFDSY